MAEKYLAVEEVAAVLSISNSEVIAATTQGHLRGFKDGSTWKYRKEDVDRFAEDLRNAVKSGDDDFGYGDDYELDDTASAVGGSSDINNTLDNDVSFTAGESGLALSEYEGDENDLVLGEDNDLTGSSLGGSGLGLSEQSGISLMSATDSGISLDDDESGEVLELGEDNLQIGSSLLNGSLAASLSVTNDDFSLTTDETDDSGEEDSGSQVIMIDENDLDGVGLDGAGDDLGMADGGLDVASDGSEVMSGPAQLIEKIVPMDMPEKPYSVLSVVGLLLCFIFLTLTLLFTVDLIRNIWSWDKTPYSSALMDWVINTFVDK